MTLGVLRVFGEPWSEGDRVPYIPQHQLNLSLGFAHKNYEMNFSGRYNGTFNTRGTNGGTLGSFGS